MPQAARGMATGFLSSTSRKLPLRTVQLQRTQRMNFPVPPAAEQGRPDAGRAAEPGRGSGAGSGGPRARGQPWGPPTSFELLQACPRGGPAAPGHPKPQVTSRTPTGWVQHIQEKSEPPTALQRRHRWNHKTLPFKRLTSQQTQPQAFISGSNLSPATGVPSK